MDEYVIVIHPNRSIVLGVNEDRPEHEYIIQIEERYEDRDFFNAYDGWIMGTTIVTLMIITTSVVYS